MWHQPSGRGLRVLFNYPDILKSRNPFSPPISNLTQMFVILESICHSGFSFENQGGFELNYLTGMPFILTSGPESPSLHVLGRIRLSHTRRQQRGL